MTKQEILNAIRQTAKDNGGKPLGVERFKKETGISEHEWGKYWARIGDAQKEAGCTPNQLQGAYSDDFLIEKVIDLTRKLGRFPTYREIKVEKNNDSQIPDRKAFQRLGTKEELACKVMEYCSEKIGYDDVIDLCRIIPGKFCEEENKDCDGVSVGEVYLFKSGRHYKIGKTNDTVRRGNEIRIQLPEKMDLIHSIKTDDPSGVEAYWHRRFAGKRGLGEWFDLSGSDVKCFKRWRRIV